MRSTVLSLQEHKHGMSCGIGFYATLAGLTVIGFRLMQKWTAGGVCRSKKRLDGKTVIITGANTGIGKETAVDMAQRGARVIVACRSAEKGEAAVAEVKERTGSADVVFGQMDLAELKSIKEFAQRILNEERRVDILINNAGVMVCPYGLTKDGFETQFGVNHLGHFYLTMLLLDRIKECAPSRIVNVSSVAYRMGGQINFDDIMSKKSYSETKAYSQSKLANVLFTRELARRLEGTGVTTYTLHPGAVRTELQRHAYSWPILGYVFRFLYPLFHITWKTPSQGAQTTIYCAVAEELEGISGKYYQDCTETKLDPRGEDDAVAKKLWEISEQYTGLA